MAKDDDAVEFTDDYPLKFLECRVQHDWRLIGHYHADGYVVRASVCARCGCDRHMRWTQGGSRGRTSYDHPDGYSVKGGVPTWEVRMTILKQVEIHSSAEAMTAALGKAIEQRKSK